MSRGVLYILDDDVLGPIHHHITLSDELPARPGSARASSPARPSGHGEARDERPERGAPGVGVHGVLAAVDPLDGLARAAQQRLAAVRAAVLPAVHEADARAARAQRLPSARRSRAPARLPSVCPNPSCPNPLMNNTVLRRQGLHCVMKTRSSLRYEDKVFTVL